MNYSLGDDFPFVNQDGQITNAQVVNVKRLPSGDSVLTYRFQRDGELFERLCLSTDKAAA
jgi:hypothetical protein